MANSWWSQKFWKTITQKSAVSAQLEEGLNKVCEELVEISKKKGKIET